MKGYILFTLGFVVTYLIYIALAFSKLVLAVEVMSHVN